MKKIVNGGNNIIISHIADIDGLGAAILGKIADEKIDIALVDNNELSNYIKQLNDTLEYQKYKKIFITDLPVRNDAINLLNENKDFNSKIVHYDHHTSEVSENKPNYLNVVPEKDGLLTSGTSLFYEYLINNYPENNVLKSQYTTDFVEAVRSYDTWDFKRTGNLNGYNLTELLSIIGIDRFLDKFYKEAVAMKKNKFFFDETDQKMIDIKKEEVANYIDECEKNLITMKFMDYNVGVVFAELYRSTLGNVLSTRYKDCLDFIMIINLYRNSISLRTVNDINLGALAKAILPDAGGQPKAAGIPLNKETRWIIDMALDNLYNKQKTK